MKYTYDYPMFSVTADMIVADVRIDEPIRVLCVKRRNDPHKGCYALPGGFVNIDETCIDAAVRELEEETNVRVDPRHVKEITYRDDPDRDPRARVITFAYGCLFGHCTGEVVAKDDAVDVDWILMEDIVDDKIKLAFDHNSIVSDFSYYFTRG
jgi:8-oxo-dGTP diphosphatase